MAKVRISGVRELRASLSKEFGGIVKDDRVLGKIGAFITKRLREEARLSRSMKTGRSLPRLSTGYQRARRSYGKTGRVGGGQKVDGKFFRPNRGVSNLTLSGRFLKSLKYIPMKTGRSKGEILVAAKGRRREGLTNSQVISYLIDRNPDYDIFGLDERAINQVKLIVQRELRRRLRNRRLS